MSRTSDSGPVPFNLMISNVPGPQHPLYVSGAQVKAHHIVSAVADGMGLNVSLLSLDGHLDFGLVADRELVPDLWTLMTYIEEEADVLEEVAKKLDASTSKTGAKATPPKPKAVAKS